MNLKIYNYDSVFKELINNQMVVMENIGFEPMTPCLQSRCSPS